jgi:tRNA (guanine-N7-)-methyltransferase
VLTARTRASRTHSRIFLDVYAFALREDGIAYTITDVLDLHNWMVRHFERHPLFERIPHAVCAPRRFPWNATTTATASSRNAVSVVVACVVCLPTPLLLFS